MPQAAMIPIAIAASAGSSVAGAAISAKAANPKMMTNLPPPAPLFPGANQQLGNLVGGQGGYGEQSIGILSQAAQTGLPTSFATNQGNISDYMPMFEALQQANKRQEAQGMANINEQFGAAGLRYSQPVMTAMVDYQSQLGKEYGNILAQYAFQATEAAKGRQFQAEENAAGRQMAASGVGLEALMNLGTSYYPTYAITSGGQSALGAGLSQGGNLGMLLAMLAQGGMLGGQSTNAGTRGTTTTTPSWGTGRGYYI